MPYKTVKVSDIVVSFDDLASTIESNYGLSMTEYKDIDTGVKVQTYTDDVCTLVKVCKDGKEFINMVMDESVVDTVIDEYTTYLLLKDEKNHNRVMSIKIDGDDIVQHIHKIDNGIKHIVPGPDGLYAITKKTK